MYEGDTPNAERRAAALSLDRDLLRELLGQDELRDLIDAGALAQVEDDLQFRSDIRRAGRRSRRAARRASGRLGDLTAAEAAMRVGRLDGVDADSMLSDLRAERRRVDGQGRRRGRWIDAADAGLYRDALGVAPPGGLPAAFVEDVPDALVRLVRRYARDARSVHRRRAAGALRRRPDRRAEGARARGALVRGELRPGGTEREWCDPEVLRRLRRASLAALRKEVEPVDTVPLPASCPRGRTSTATRVGRRGRPAARGARAAAGAGAAGRCLGARRAAPPRRRVLADVDGSALRRRARSCGSGAGALGRNSGRVALYFREDLAELGPPQLRGATAGTTDQPQHDAVRERLAAGACFFTDLLVDVELAPEELQEALWDLVWAGEATNDAFSPLRAPRLTLARAQRDRGACISSRRRAVRVSPARRGAAAQVQGRWSLTAPLFARGGRSERASPGARRAAARTLRRAHARTGPGRGDRRRLLGDLRRALAT